MAWTGYKVPKFNVWFAIYYWIPTSDAGDFIGYYQGPYYIKGQLRSGDRTGHGFGMEVAFPKGAELRSAIDVKGSEDIIQAAGWGDYWCFISLVEDSGAGFPNEHRIATIVPRGTGIFVINPLECFRMPPVNTELEPPEDYTPVGIMSPADDWVAPYADVTIYAP